MALVVVMLLCAHPVLLAGAEGWMLLIRLKMHWYIWVGRIALALLLAQVATALIRGAMRLSYERWRRAHNIVAVTILALGFTHAIRTGDDLHGGLPLTLFALGPAIGLGALLYSRGIRPHLLARRAFRVHSVRQEAARVWTVTLDAPARQPLRFLPGQFQFLRFIDSDLPVEEHPFTIASSPTTADRINVTIKSCGDFTDLIDRIQSGDRATVHGPFGRFSHDMYSSESHLVFVAGGVGITPLMSMLRAMRDRREARRVTLVYASRTLDDVLFTPELIAMESAGNPALEVVYVLSDPPLWWGGEAGRVDVQRLVEWCGGLEDKSFYLCCPPSMNVALVRGLRRRGVNASRIHCDHFSL
jgi:predicted ferric reductase